jgi:hypothetical protein
MRYILLASLVILAGCATKPPEKEITYVKVEVPGPVVYCKIPTIEKPIDLFAKIKVTDTKYDKDQALLADRELSKGYELKLEKAITTCNQSD